MASAPAGRARKLRVEIDEHGAGNVTLLVAVALGSGGGGPADVEQRRRRPAGQQTVKFAGRDQRPLNRSPILALYYRRRRGIGVRLR